MLITKVRGENKIVIDFCGRYPCEPLFIDGGGEIDFTLQNGKVNIKGGKAPLLDAIKGAILAFKNIRYGQFEYPEDTKWRDCTWSNDHITP